MGLLSTIGTIGGAYLGGPVGGAIGGAVGGALEGGMQTAGGMKQSSAAQQNALNAAAASQFRPVGITNTFGSSNFGFNPTTGQLTSAGYTLSPELQAYQNAVMGNTRQSLGDITALQNLGRGYLAQSPEQAAAKWMQGQQALLAPSRDLAWANAAQTNFNQGTGGLSVAQGGGLQAANPIASALANAQAMQDLQLASQAQQQGQQQVAFGQGLLNTAYQPFTAGLNTASAIENMGQQPFELSSSLASRSAQAGANAGRYLTTPAASYSSKGTLLSALGGGLSGFSGNLGGLFGNGYGWTTGSSVIPQSTFNGLSTSEAQSMAGGADTAALFGL